MSPGTLEYPTTVKCESDALIELIPTVWYGAHCPDHDRREDDCVACQATPNWCEKHSWYRPGSGVSDPIGECVDCQRLRPGSLELPPAASMVTSAEHAFTLLGIPRQLMKSGRVLRVPWRDGR